MPALKDAKIVGAPFSNTSEIVRVTYDFTADGGEVEDNTLFTADGEVLVRCVGAHVLTAVTSGGSATIDLGRGTSGTQFLSGSAISGFTAGAFVPSASAAAIKLANGEIINMGVNVAALTAGKVEFIFELIQA